MKFITYKQYDSRWGSRNYNGSSNMATAGCGPTSVATLLSGINPKITPIETMKFMQKNGYAAYNHGTDWSGIPACMKWGGLTDVGEVDVRTTMKGVWDILSKPGYVADFLFSAGSRGGVCWTKQGHYVAVTNYKVKDGKHWLYTRDSGGRNHDGWYCYEDTMRGLVFKVWVGKTKDYKPYKPSKPYDGKLPKLPSKEYLEYGDKGANVESVQTFLNWVISAGLDVDGKFGNKTATAVMEYQIVYDLKIDGKFGKESLAKARQIVDKYSEKKDTNASKIMDKAIEYAYPKGTEKKKYEVKTGSPKKEYTKALDKVFPKHKSWKKEIRNGASCSVFVATSVRSSGVDKTFMCDDPPKILDYMKQSKKWLKQNDGMRPLPITKLKPGDVICYEKKGSHGNGHILLYKGDGYCVEANFGRCYPHTLKIPNGYLNANYIKNTFQRFAVYRVKED